ncbi:MAG: PIN domain-containing protein [Alphaproteobacteria bacterium]|nr:PIN domain-containing protein [Alphaproteobacteria bacterium]
MKAVFDTNILIDFLNGIEPARRELRRFDSRLVSVITWIEVLVGAAPGADDAAVRRFLGRFEIVPLSAPVAETAVDIRRAHRIRLSDAVIWATARVQQALLVTRNVRDFPVDAPEVRIPYRL